jgi:antitoxin component of MazEF toxin-antitoxin module
MSIQINPDKHEAQAQRKVVNQGGSVGVCIPKSIADRLDIQEGMTVTVVDNFDNDTTIRIETNSQSDSFDNNASQGVGGDGT